MPDDSKSDTSSQAVGSTSSQDRILPQNPVSLAQLCESLLAASTPDIYRNNAFRITGLSVDATPREIKRRINELKDAEEMGDAEDEHTHVFALTPPPSTELIRQAAQRLDDPEKRIIDEFFWFWPEDWSQGKQDPFIASLLCGDKDKALNALNIAVSAGHSSASAATKHNLAVIHQLMALDAELHVLNANLDNDHQETVNQHWRTCFRWWEELTDDESFWSLVTERIRLLDDPRITTGFARRMRATLPHALDKINAILALAFIERGKHDSAVQHLQYMIDTHQGQDDVAGTLSLVATPLFNRLQNAIDHAEKSCRGTASSAHSAVTNMLQMAKEPVQILKQFLPDDDPQLIDTCDSLAIACLHCHRTLVNDTNATQKQWNQAIAILKEAIPLAASKEIKGDIETAKKVAERNKLLAHPKVQTINTLIKRALSENLKSQLKTLSQDVASAIDVLRNDVGDSSGIYKTAVDLVASTLRGLSVQLIPEFCT